MQLFCVLTATKGRFELAAREREREKRVVVESSSVEHRVEISLIFVCAYLTELEFSW